MDNTISLKELRPGLPKVIKNIDSKFDRYIVIKRGTPIAVMLSPDDYEDIWEGERAARTGCVATKSLLVERMLGYFAEARARYAELKARPGLVDEILAAGAERLAPFAAETLAECHERMGLAPRR